MPLPSLSSLSKPLALSTLDRARRWWHRLAPHRQDRVAGLAPLAAVLLFFAAIVSALGYLRLEEIDREQQAVQRDVEYTQQRLRLRLLERQEQLMRIAREISNRELDVEDFRARARSMLNQYPELQGLAWIDERRKVKSAIGTAVLVSSQLTTGADTVPRNDTMSGFMMARESQQPTYIQPLGTPSDTPFLQMHLPLTDRARFSGVMLAEYSVDGLYRYGVPTEVTSRYAISLQDAKGGLLTGTAIPAQKTVKNLLPWTSPTNEYAMPVSPVGSALVVKGQAYRASLGVIGSGLFWLVSALSDDGMDADCQLAPHTQTRSGPAGTPVGNHVSTGHGKLHAHRHARHGLARPYHLRQRSILSNDRLDGIRTGRTHRAVSLLA